MTSNDKYFFVVVTLLASIFIISFQYMYDFSEQSQKSTIKKQKSIANHFAITQNDE